MKPIYLPNNSVQVRFTCIKVSSEEYDMYFKFFPSYTVVKREGTIRHPFYYLMTKIANSEEVERQYLEKNEKFICDLCKDRGVTDKEGGFIPCTCDFGKIVNKSLCTS